MENGPKKQFGGLLDTCFTTKDLKEAIIVWKIWLNFPSKAHHWDTKDNHKKQYTTFRRVIRTWHVICLSYIGLRLILIWQKNLIKISIQKRWDWDSFLICLLCKRCKYRHPCYWIVVGNLFGLVPLVFVMCKEYNLIARGMHDCSWWRNGIGNKLGFMVVVMLGLIMENDKRHFISWEHEHGHVKK